MKKLLVLVLISALVFGCKKDEVKDPVIQEGEISFAITLNEPGAGLKTDYPPACLNLEPDYAWVQINGVDYYPLVFRINGVLYTQNIKLMVDDGPYTVNEFVLYDDGGTPGGALPETDDKIVMATPRLDATYAPYVTKTVDFGIDLVAFQKKEIPVEVLCFIPDVYQEFGFDWFVITEIIVREECFFGDICIKDVSANTGYGMTGSPYLSQGTIQLDMPAIMMINVFEEGTTTHVPYSPFTNYPLDGQGNYSWVGGPLCINWPDNLQDPGEVFDIEIWIMVQDGDAGSPPFAYNLFWTGTLTELGVLKDLAGNVIPAGDDGIIELVLGDCNLMGTDIQLLPYQNLPSTCTMYVQNPPYEPGDLGTYFDITLSNIPAGYDLYNGEWGAFCGDQLSYIYLGTTYTPTIYGSLDPTAFPAAMLQKTKDNMDLANFVFNNLENYPGYTWQDIQDALWYLIDDYDTGHFYSWPLSSISQDMVDDAMDYGDGYLPPPGGWAAVLFWNGVDVQMVFTFVDP